MSDYDQLAADVNRLAAENDRLRAVAKAYEQWEADLLLCGEAWAPMRSLPQLTQELWDRLLEIQGQRNAALSGS